MDNAVKPIDRAVIESLAEAIRRKFRPQQIILFGSHARGASADDSDIDLLVVMETSLKPHKQASAIRLFIDEMFGVFHPIDIIVRTPEAIRERFEAGDSFIKQAVEQGVRL